MPTYTDDVYTWELAGEETKQRSRENLTVYVKLIFSLKVPRSKAAEPVEK